MSLNSPLLSPLISNNSKLLMVNYENYRIFSHITHPQNRINIFCWKGRVKAKKEISL